MSFLITKHFYQNKNYPHFLNFSYFDKNYLIFFYQNIFFKFICLHHFKYRWLRFIFFSYRMIYASKFLTLNWKFLPIYNFFLRKTRKPFFKKFFNFLFFSFKFFFKNSILTNKLNKSPTNVEFLIFFKKSASLMKRRISLKKNIMFSLFFQKKIQKKFLFWKSNMWPKKFGESLINSKFKFPNKIHYKKINKKIASISNVGIKEGYSKLKFSINLKKKYYNLFYGSGNKTLRAGVSIFRDIKTRGRNYYKLFKENFRQILPYFFTYRFWPRKTLRSKNMRLRYYGILKKTTAASIMKYTELSLKSILLQSRFILSQLWYARFLIEGIIFVNGVCKSPNDKASSLESEIKVTDTIQLIFNEEHFYIKKYIKSQSMWMGARSTAMVYNFINVRRKYMKTPARLNSNWARHGLYLSFKGIPRYLEVDYITLSIIIVFDPTRDGLSISQTNYKNFASLTSKLYFWYNL